MSVELDWPGLLEDLLIPTLTCDRLTTLLNTSLTDDLEMMIQKVRFTAVDLTAMQTAPQIELLDVREVKDEFLIAAGRCRDINSPPPLLNNITEDESESNVNISVIDGTSLLFRNPAESNDLKTLLLQHGLQVHLRLAFDNPVNLTVEGEAVVNQPSPAFLALPLQLSITRIAINAELILAVIDDILFLSLDHNTDAMSTSLFDVQFTVDIGDKSKHVLKNVAKIERFAAERLKAAVDEHLRSPHFLQLHLSKLNL